MDNSLITVTMDNFVKAETARMFDGMLLKTGGKVNVFYHDRTVTPVDEQNVIRMNRDTIYSFALVDISNGATLTLPKTDGRYMSAMVVNEDHYINNIFHEAGEHKLTVDEFDTDYVLVAVRTFVDPTSPADVKIANEIQDKFHIKSNSARPYQHPNYDEQSRKEVHEELLRPENQFDDASGSFGKKSEVDPQKHLAATASGWGGLPESEAFYMIDTEPRDVGDLTLTLGDVPVDAFWSLSIYNSEGFFEQNTYDSYSINSTTAEANEDGSVTLNLSHENHGKKNFVYIYPDWNYTFRLYRPRKEVVEGNWKLPDFEPV